MSMSIRFFGFIPENFIPPVDWVIDNIPEEFEPTQRGFLFERSRAYHRGVPPMDGESSADFTQRTGLFESFRSLSWNDELGERLRSDREEIMEDDEDTSECEIDYDAQDVSLVGDNGVGVGEKDPLKKSVVEGFNKGDEGTEKDTDGIRYVTIQVMTS